MSRLKKYFYITGGLILLILSIIFWSISGNGERHLIPENYEGLVEIIFNVEDGVPEKYEGRKRIYEIPENGILETQFEYNNGWIRTGDLQYYYVSKDGRKERLPNVYNPEILPLDTVQVFGISSAGNPLNPESPKVVYVVGKYENENALLEEKYGIKIK